MIRSRFEGLVAGVLLVAVGLAVGGVAPAQVREPGEAVSAGEHAGSLSEISRPLRVDSIAVHDGAQSLGEASGGSMHAAPVHAPNAPSMISGPVSSVSRGPMSGDRAPLTAPAVTEASTGAVTHDNASPLGERISEPMRELGPLRQQMRKQREQAERVALQQPMPPVASDTDAGATQPALAAPEQRADAEFGTDSDGLDPEGDLHGEDAPAPTDPDPSN